MYNNVLVSIGIPAYNCESFISLAISSVLKQTYSNFELIITDDGSKDSTLEVINSFNDPRIKLIANTENKGISFRLNQQIDLAIGKYFVRMDADDIMFPSRIEKQVSYLESHPNIEVIGSQAIVIDNKDQIIGLRDSSIPKSLNEALRKNIFIHPTVAGRIDWYRKFGYSNELKGVEDFDLWIRSFNYSKFHKLDEPLLFYRDPLQIKLNTYRFRQQQLRKCLWENHNLIKNNKYLVFISIESYLKTSVFQIATTINLDQLLIAWRNTPINNELSLHYSNLINQIKYG